MSEHGPSRLLQVMLVLATFVVLAAIGWGVSVGVGIFRATEKAAESRAEVAEIAPPPAPPAPTPPAPAPTPTPVAPSTESIQAEIQARFEAERAKLEKQLDDAAHEVEEEQPVRVGGGVTAPEKISGAEPAYTEVARRARIQGVVILEAIIDREGKVTSTRVLKGLPMGLDAKAREAVAGWRFNPGRRDGEPVAVLYTVTVNFRVE